MDDSRKARSVNTHANTVIFSSTPEIFTHFIHTPPALKPNICYNMWGGPTVNSHCSE